LAALVVVLLAVFFFVTNFVRVDGVASVACNAKPVRSQQRPWPSIVATKSTISVAISSQIPSTLDTVVRLLRFVFWPKTLSRTLLSPLLSVVVVAAFWTVFFFTGVAEPVTDLPWAFLPVTDLPVDLRLRDVLLITSFALSSAFGFKKENGQK